MSTTQFPLTISTTGGEGHTITLAVRIDVTADQPANQVLHYLRSVQVKNDIMHEWVRENAPGYGMEIRGGPAPIFEKPGDRSSTVVGYQQEFRLTRPV